MESTDGQDVYDSCLGKTVPDFGGDGSPFTNKECPEKGPALSRHCFVNRLDGKSASRVDDLSEKDIASLFPCELDLGGFLDSEDAVDAFPPEVGSVIEASGISQTLGSLELTRDGDFVAVPEREVRFLVNRDKDFSADGEYGVS